MDPEDFFSAKIKGEVAMKKDEKEITQGELDVMLQKTQDMIAAKEISIKKMEKTLKQEKNRLAILKGREGRLKLEAMKKKFGVQSDDELMQRMEAALK